MLIKKLEPRAKKCIFLGYASNVKGYRLWYPDPKSLNFIISRDETFDESASGMGHWKKMIKITGDTDYYYCTIILSITCI